VFRKILIANRGEIAVRVIRACRDMGIPAVAVYSTADAEAVHVRFADESVCIGPPAPRDSYLNAPAVLSAARIAGCDAIHPGYGFMSENPEFAEACEACGITFIGPTAETMRLMGDKVRGRATLVERGVPILPGTGALTEPDEAIAAAERIGYPVLVKASAGGGGRGMRVVEDPSRLIELLGSARSEAKAGFGNDTVFLEKYLARPRHIEVQVLGDGKGNAVHLLERECSLQRRHQKILEESPSPAIDAETRARMGGIAARAVAAVNYRGAGTLEFLLDEDGQFYFLEMNTRLQVEHPVTEIVTGTDLVTAQIRIAAGEPIPYRQEDIRPLFSAIECRICAEDPTTYTPSAGRITGYHEPGGPGVRVDSGFMAGSVVPPYYDSLLSKVITRGVNREHAIQRMRRALLEYLVEGVKTNLALHLRILRDPEFQSGVFDTKYLTRLLAAREG